jgi:hypothetical protein
MQHINETGNPLWIWAKRPIGTGFVRLAAHNATVGKFVDLGSKAKLGEFWGLVHGNPGPMPDGFPEVQTSGLKEPSGIFRGLKRPLHYVTPRADSQVLAYITCPDWSYEFRNSRHGNAIVTCQKPTQSVFTTFVSFASEHIDEARKNMRDDAPADLDGVVLFWEWTESSPDNPRFPFDHENRYNQRLMP